MDNDTSNTLMVIPSFGGIPELKMEMSRITEAERRIVEAKTVNPVTYVDLEHSFNEAYRDLKKHLSAIGFQLMAADKALKEAKATVLLDKYPEIIKDRPKSHDNADLRDSVLIRDPDYSAAIDRINQLKALESYLEGKIKVMENVCRYMRKQMDILIRSGLSNADLYSSGGRK